MTFGISTELCVLARIGNAAAAALIAVSLRKFLRSISPVAPLRTPMILDRSLRRTGRNPAIDQQRLPRNVGARVRCQENNGPI